MSVKSDFYYVRNPNVEFKKLIHLKIISSLYVNINNIFLYKRAIFQKQKYTCPHSLPGERF